MKKVIGIGVLVALIAGGVWFFSSDDDDATFVACTLDAKICPDGSAVGRTGPDCKFAACTGESTIHSADFRIGESSSLGTVRLTPLEIVTDSRCPTDVECVWAGELEVLVQVEGHQHIFTLGEKKSVEGHLITLVSASPDAISTRELTEEDYILRFSTALE